MANRRRIITLLLIALPMVVVALLIWTYYGMQQGVVSAYYEWGVTGIIASYAEDHNGEPPGEWSDLAGYEYHSPYLPDPRDFELAAQYVSVDFESLKALKDGEIKELPVDVIKPLRGFEMHWISPKWQLEQYFQTGKCPEGSFDAEEAQLLREGYFGI